MPGFDGTGPWGAGPMTGGRRGVCAPASRSGIAYGRGVGVGRGYGRGIGPGRGYGMRSGGRGRGMGRCWWEADYAPQYNPVYPMSAEREAGFLRDQAQSLKQELEDISARISQLEDKEN